MTEQSLEVGNVQPTRDSGTLGVGGEPSSEVYVASQWRLMWWKFRKHRLAMASAAFLICMYVVVVFCEFLAPYTAEYRDGARAAAPPQRIHFFSEDGVHLRIDRGTSSLQMPYLLHLCRTRLELRRYEYRYRCHLPRGWIHKRIMPW